MYFYDILPFNRLLRTGHTFLIIYGGPREHPVKWFYWDPGVPIYLGFKKVIYNYVNIIFIPY